MTRRLAIILLLGSIAAGGLYSFQRYLDNPNSAINRTPDSWLTKSRLVGIAAHFPAGQTLPRRDGRPAYPPVDLAITARTETALFALG